QNIGDLPVAESFRPEPFHLFDGRHFAFADLDLAPDDLLPIGQVTFGPIILSVAPDGYSEEL
ncbi:MAG: hypothetical protein WCI18_07630, partial [Pseudomonadota bacterium]